jgi:hypothetical protein
MMIIYPKLNRNFSFSPKKLQCGLTTEEMVILGGGVIVGFAAVFTTGWIAVTFGAVSLGIAIYDEVNQ